MDPILDKARVTRNLLERIVDKIPGFKGYQDRELRRDADQLQREHLASLLEHTKRALNDIALAATRSGSLDVINDVETARKRLDKAIARVRYADRGYSAFFDTVKVDETVLERVYQFDLGLLDGVEEVQLAAQQAAAAAEVATAVRAFIERIDALDARLADREAILSGVK
jgi:hypothetical protein